MQGEDVWECLEFFEDEDLALEEDLVDLVLEEAEVDDLDCHVVGSVVVPALVDLAGVALPDDVV